MTRKSGEEKSRIAAAFLGSKEKRNYAAISMSPPDIPASTTTTFAALGPFSPFSISNCTVSPTFILSNIPLQAELWKKTSGEPSTLIKPNPLSVFVLITPCMIKGCRRIKQIVEAVFPPPSKNTVHEKGQGAKKKTEKIPIIRWLSFPRQRAE